MKEFIHIGTTYPQAKVTLEWWRAEDGELKTVRKEKGQPTQIYYEGFPMFNEEDVK